MALFASAYLAHAEFVDAVDSARRILSEAGLVACFNKTAKVYAEIGIFRADVSDDLSPREIEKMRQRGVKVALLDAKGKLALSIAGRNETTQEWSVSGNTEMFRMACKALADIDLAGCKELPASESWSKERRLYKIAIPVVYKPGQMQARISVSADWDESDAAFVQYMIDSLDASQRIGCVMWRRRNGREYIVSFGCADIRGDNAKDIYKAAKTAELVALGNMAFWLNSNIAFREVARSSLVEGEGKSLEWEDFVQSVAAHGKCENFPYNEVASGRCTSPLTKAPLCWCAFAARLECQTPHIPRHRANGANHRADQGESQLRR